MASINIKKELKKLFIAVLREVFARDEDFPYNKDDALETSIVISPRYAAPETENLLPQLIISANSYGTSVESLFNNFWQEAPGSLPGTITKRKYTNIVQFQLSIEVLSTVKEECEDLSDKVFNIINHEYANLFRKLHLDIQNLSVSDTGVKQQYPQYNFISTIGVSGAFRLEWVVSPEKDDGTELLKQVKFTINELELEL